MMSAGAGLREGETLTEPPRAGRRRGDLDVGEHVLDHGRGVDDALELLVVAHRVGVHVLVRAASDLDLVVDCAIAWSITPSELRGAGRGGRLTGDNVRLVSEPGEPLRRARRVPGFVDVGLRRGRDPRAVRELPVPGVRVVRIEGSLVWTTSVRCLPIGDNTKTNRGRHSSGRSTSSSPSRPSPAYSPKYRQPSHSSSRAESTHAGIVSRLLLCAPETHPIHASASGGSATRFSKYQSLPAFVNCPNGLYAVTAFPPQRLIVTPNSAIVPASEGKFTPYMSPEMSLTFPMLIVPYLSAGIVCANVALSPATMTSEPGADRRRHREVGYRERGGIRRRVRGTLFQRDCRVIQRG